MRGVLMRGLLLACGGIGVCGSACSADRHEHRERVASTRAALEINDEVILKSARKVCQFIGDTDYETGHPTLSQTERDFSIPHTDLGYPVEQGNRTWFFFGDVSVGNDLDPLGFTDEKPQLSDPSDRNSPSTCPKLNFVTPGGDAQAQALTLFCDDPPHRGPLLRGGEGFNVPTGFAFDPVGNRLIGHFVLGLGTKDPTKVKSILAEASLAPGRSAKDFTCIHTPLSGLARQYSMIAPWIVDGDELGYGEKIPGTGSQVLLVFGTGFPYRETGVRLAAVRLQDVTNATRWRFYHASQNKWLIDPQPPTEFDPSTGHRLSSDSELDAIASPGSAGEFSVSFDPTYREWRLVHGLSSAQLSPSEQGPISNGLARNVTLMRTAQRPEGPWSETKFLFVMKQEGTPQWADEGQGRFIHHGNTRAYRPGGGALERLAIDPVNLRTDDPPPPFTCAQTFPSYCLETRPDTELVVDSTVGCCTRSDRCCDRAFSWSGVGPAPGSWQDGTPYAQYLIPSFTQNFRDNTRAPLPDRQRVFWTMSTLNPYVVDLMSTDLNLWDWDGDRVPNEKDNCPLTFNPSQANCNADAEIAARERGDTNAIELGDACDPVPCPQAQLDETAVLGCDGSPFSVGGCFGRSVRDLIMFTPVGPSLSDTLRTAPVTEAPPVIALPAENTHARFCQEFLDPPDPDKRFNCKDANVMRDTQLTVAASAELELSLPSQPWHRITLGREKCPAIGKAPGCAGRRPRGEAFALDYDGTPDSRRWYYADDYAFWTGPTRRIPEISADLKPTCENPFYGPGTCLNGRLWFHAESLIGDPTHPTTPGGAFVGSHGAELANNYVDASPDHPFFRVYGGLRARELRLKLQSLLDLVDPPPAWRFNAGAALPLINQGSSLLAVFDDGHRENVDFIATDAMRAKLTDPTYRWVSPAEASPFVGGRTAPLAVALSTDGTTVLSTPRVLEGKLDEGVGCQINSDVCNPPHARTSVASASPARGSSPTERTDFVAVYSRAKGRVFVVGGRDKSTGALQDNVWAYRMEDGHWDRFSSRQALGEVVDATFSWRDGRLWILAFDPQDATHRTLRLIAFEPTTGASQVIASAAQGPIPKYDFRGLFLDMEGNVGVYASSARAQKHRFGLLLRRPGGYDLAMTPRRDRHLSAPPIVDLRGFALYFEPDRPPEDRSNDAADDPQSGDRTRAAARLPHLPLRTAAMTELQDLLK